MKSPEISGDVCEVPVFRPTMDEMRLGFETYIHKIENQIAIKGLVCQNSSPIASIKQLLLPSAVVLVRVCFN